MDTIATAPTSDTFVKLKNRVINKNFIRWMEEHGPCYKLCTLLDGCQPTQLHEVCKGDIGFDVIDKLYNNAKQ